jgi:Rrf2 family iron-sulfur cluster assembly transcriptional regulator
MLSNTCKYAVRAVIYLSVHAVDESKKIGIKKISDDLKIPSPFLGKILQVLAKNKILFSTKGPNGGFSMGKHPKDVTLMDIVLIIDGDGIFTECLIGIQSCSNGSVPCPTNKKYAPIREQIKKMFSEQNFEELADSFKNNTKIAI